MPLTKLRISALRSGIVPVYAVANLVQTLPARRPFKHLLHNRSIWIDLKNRSLLAAIVDLHPPVAVRRVSGQVEAS